MSTRESIIDLGDELVRDKGFNAFSFYDISKTLGIKNASIHYHFPTKASLGVAIVQQHLQKLNELRQRVAGRDPMTQMKAFLSIYTSMKEENKVCIVGSLATDLHTVDKQIQDELKILVNTILDWLTSILTEGRSAGVFAFSSTPRTKALLVASTMMASLQLSRLTNEKDFNTIKETVLKELKP